MKLLAAIVTELQSWLHSARLSTKTPTLGAYGEKTYGGKGDVLATGRE